MEGPVTVDSAAIKNIRLALKELAQTMIMVNGNINLLLTELNHELNYSEALQTVNQHLKVILQIISEVRSQIARLDQHRESFMTLKEQPQPNYTPQGQPDSTSEGPGLAVTPEFVKDLANTGQNIRQRLHELAQPLVVVTGTVDLLLMEVDQDSKHYQRLQTISENLENIVIIIDEVRKVARKVGKAL
ncbi:MAG: hypothetical protein PHW74_10180 [Desulfobacca sp.]|nr:hypothetical protein [Desulfobacca sp.]